MPNEIEEASVQDQLRRYLFLTRERWYVIALVTVIILLLGIGLAQLWPATYESSTLFVLRESQLVDDTALEKALKDRKVAVKRQTLMSEIRSNSRIMEVLKELEWEEYIKARNSGDLMDFIGKAGESLDVLINPDPVGETQVEFKFTWRDPQKAADFCNTMRDNWIDLKIINYEKGYGDRLERADVVLRERLESYNLAQQELDKFERDEDYAALGTLDELNRQKTDLTKAIDDSRAVVLSYGKQIARLEAELENLSPTVNEEKKSINPDYAEAMTDWKKKRKQYDDKAVRLVETHPELITLREAVEAAKKHMDDMEDMKYILEGFTGKPNPEYNTKVAVLDQLKPQHENAVETLRLNEERLEEVDSKVRVLPGLMAERDRLMAEIELSRTEYQRAHEEIQPLKDRVKSFKTVFKVGGVWEDRPTFKDQTFEVLTPATPPSVPKNPVTMIILIISLFIGLGLGLIFALIGEILRTSFSTQEEVAVRLKKPVLGMVNRIVTEADVRAIRWRKMLFTSSSLLVIFSIVAIMFICNQYPQLIPLAVIEKVNEIREALS